MTPIIDLLQYSVEQLEIISNYSRGNRTPDENILRQNSTALITQKKIGMPIDPADWPTEVSDTTITDLQKLLNR